MIQLKKMRLLGALAALIAATSITPSAHAQIQMERLSRGVIAMRTGSSQVYVGWRLFGTDGTGTSFNLYRSSNGGAAMLLNGTPLTGSTNFVDTSAPPSQSNTYFVRPIVGGVEQASSASFTLPANAATRQYIDIPLQIPAGGTTPSGESYTYSANDLSVGDLDGDGELEYVLKWDPSNAKDNSQSGYTGNVYLDAYELNGTRLWRIDLGRNIRAGAHYTQFMVYDFDGDGRAEVMTKTADGTRSGTGQVIGSSSADYRNSSGYILSGPEFLTVFNGQNGAILATTNYVPARGTVSSWGDSYGNRVDRFLAGVAYLDGQRPSAIFSRGYYTRAVIAAWDWRNGQLTQRWVIDSNNVNALYGQGNHNLSIADVDGDGRQEIVFGAATINDNGTLMYASGLGHGDALHVGDFDTSRAGLEIWGIHESSNQPGADLRSAGSGARIFATPNNNGAEGPGRGVAGDIWSGNAGAEYWGSGPNMTFLRNASGANIGRNPGSANSLVWWDGDTVRELLDSTNISKYGTGGDTRLLTGDSVATSNGTKSNAALSADLFGDWREEVVWRTSNNSALRIYTTTNVASNRIYTLLHDPQYRVAVAWQNVAYNQPPHPGFFIGANMSTPPTPNIVLVGGGTDPNPNPGTSLYPAENATLSGGTLVESTNGGYNGTGYVNSPANGGVAQFSNVDGRGGGSKTLRIRYANGTTGARTGQLVVNGATTSITFNSTGAWTSWQNQTVTVNLNNNSTNVIRLQSNGQDLANIDEIEVQ
jgi:rhamnogalacturonan endolyase